ncbi:class I SAM-dependent methyltransferase [Patulibacter sp.]|uniref:class I SAM-dependent methyltransferase n=1 Tax=Patulibacter sp. TaxID=1912859 RepID=UPI002726FDF2|nr:methyltransferase domain-containing protein [Patulibacter sp.]MDO9409218.1 methyltransferase domain-containing protein [Patulibacter sp.]
MQTVDHPVFSRVWSWAMRHEPAKVVRARGDLLAGLHGRVLEVGAGTGSNFAHYPESVEEVVAVEPDRALRDEAERAATAHEAVHPGTRIRVVDGTFEELPADAAGPFDAVVCALVLCSVADVPGSLAAARRALRPGGELRYYEHVATDGWLGGVQRAVDATFWPRAFGGCHTHRDTVAAIDAAGFERVEHRDVRAAPSWAPVPISPMALGIARRPD